MYWRLQKELELQDDVDFSTESTQQAAPPQCRSVLGKQYESNMRSQNSKLKDNRYVLIQESSN